MSGEENNSILKELLLIINEDRVPTQSKFNKFIEKGYGDQLYKKMFDDVITSQEIFDISLYSLWKKTWYNQYTCID